MAAAALGVEELRELVAVLAQALADVEVELVRAVEGGVPLPEDLQDRLRERTAFIAAFERLPEGELRGKLRTMFKQEMAHASPERDVIEGPEVDDSGVEFALQRLRVARLFDPELHALVCRDAPSLAWT